MNMRCSVDSIRAEKKLCILLCYSFIVAVVAVAVNTIKSSG